MPNKEYYIKLRNEYTPDEIKRIFILESPPASGKYFYDISGRIAEPLYKAMVIAFNIDAKTKEDGLNQFCKKGNIIVDATYLPVNNLKGKARREAILKDYESLKKDLRNLDKVKSVNIIIVKTTLYDLLYQKLVKESFNIANCDIRIPFPSNGNQKKFQKMLMEVLVNLT